MSKEAYERCLEELVCEPNVFPETLQRVTDYVASLEAQLAEKSKPAKKAVKKAKKAGKK